MRPVAVAQYPVLGEWVAAESVLCLHVFKKILIKLNEFTGSLSLLQQAKCTTSTTSLMPASGNVQWETDVASQIRLCVMFSNCVFCFVLFFYARDESVLLSLKRY